MDETALDEKWLHAHIHIVIYHILFTYSILTFFLTVQSSFFTNPFTLVFYEQQSFTLIGNGNQERACNRIKLQRNHRCNLFNQIIKLSKRVE